MVNGNVRSNQTCSRMSESPGFLMVRTATLCSRATATPENMSKNELTKLDIVSVEVMDL